MRIIFTLFIFIGLSFNTFSQNHWTSLTPSEITSLHNLNDDPLPATYKVFNLDLDGLKNYLQSAPMEFTDAAHNQPLLLSLPMPDGSLQAFEVAESSIMEQGLSDKFPEIKTFIIQGVEDPTATGRMDFNAANFHAFVLSANGSFLVNPAGDHYVSFFKKDKTIPKTFKHECNFDHTQNEANQVSLRDNLSIGEELRTYRFAVSATGEFSNFHGGTVNSVIAAITTSTNRINTVFERDMAVRLILVANNDEIVFLDSNTDPFTNGNAGAMLGENQNAINAAIGSDNYDIGHVFTTAGSGLASFESACSNDKAQGTTGVSPPIGDFFDIDYAAHEIGHQFGGNHTFNNCGGNENQGTGFEPGSGATIMAYAGLCSGNNLQFNSDDYFHGVTLQEFENFIDAGGINCATTIPVNNTPPTVSIIDGGFNIPISTPFELTAVSDDLEGDALTYCWEQFDSGGSPVPLGSPTGNAPLFRSFQPTQSPTRVFPRIENVINNNLFSDVEYTPDYDRFLSFNVTVRDNNAGAGGIAYDQLQFRVSDTAGPFLVTNPNNATTWEVGQWLEVNWDVANTDNSTVNCQKVNVKLSVDGGFTYPYSLADNVENNGSTFISVPNVITDLARVRVEAADNIFFDISNTNFSIAPPSQPGFSYFITPNFQESCLPFDATIEIVTDSLLGYNQEVTYNITTPIPSGIVPSFSTNPALPSEGSVLTLDMSNYNLSDTFDVTIQAIASGLDTAYRTVTIRTIGNNFSDFVAEFPADGETGVDELPDFRWHSGQSAEQYFIQIAKSPTFEASTIHAEAITVDTFFTPPTQLDISAQYFWRVKASNECGDQEYLPLHAFHTIVLACEKYENNDSETISSQGLPTVENIINIPSGGMISDLNIAKIKGNHNNMNHLDVSLISPSGTEVLLFSNACIVSTNFDFGLDDEAPGNIICPPSNGTMFLPENPLSAFDGETATGEWILQTVVNNSAGDGGKIQNFHLEICSNFSINAPYLVTNELLPVPLAQGRAITNDFLLTQDDNNTSIELTYTLVTAPEHGQLFFLGSLVNQGETFRQSSLDAGNVIYVHNGDNNQFDKFTFTVTDGEGGFFGTPEFNIEIDPDLVLDINNLLDKNQITIAPNPNDGFFNISFEKPIWEKLKVSMFNVHGQLVVEKNLNEVNSNIEVNAPHLPNGIYFIKIEAGTEFLVFRVAIGI